MLPNSSDTSCTTSSCLTTPRADKPLQTRIRFAVRTRRATWNVQKEPARSMITVTAEQGERPTQPLPTLPDWRPVWQQNHCQPGDCQHCHYCCELTLKATYEKNVTGHYGDEHPDRTELPTPCDYDNASDCQLTGTHRMTVSGQQCHSMGQWTITLYGVFTGVTLFRLTFPLLWGLMLP